MAAAQPAKLGFARSFVGSIGAMVIFALIRIFGKRVKESETPWLKGPYGSDYIGDRPYEECAKAENLTMKRDAQEGGLLTDMSELNSDLFDVDRIHPQIRKFYEETTQYRMDVWAHTPFPASIGMWLLVTTISRKVNQLNFPLTVLDTAKGMESEIVHLRDSAGRLKYAGWYRRMTETKHVIYTGFYMTETMPHSGRPNVKVIFPMPQGNATVILQPTHNEDRSFDLRSAGEAFGDSGFYRITEVEKDRLCVWRIRSLKEHLHLYVDDEDVLRCDHKVSFLGFPTLHLHFRIERND